jgi:hypothetical protein
MQGPLCSWLLLSLGNDFLDNSFTFFVFCIKEFFFMFWLIVPFIQFCLLVVICWCWAVCVSSCLFRFL